MFPNLVFKCVTLFPFHLSPSSTESPKLHQRILDAVKLYIYTPEDGKYLIFVYS